MSDNANLIMVSEIVSKLKKENTFEENIRLACKEAKDNWLITNENEQFRGMVGALGVFYKDDVVIFDRIRDEMEVINTMSSPNPNIFALLGNRAEPIGFIKYWKGEL